MTQEQKQYIEENIDLIETSKWEELFRKDCPDGLGNYLYSAGIDFLSQISTLPNNAFRGSNISEIQIPDNITTIDAYAFARCKSLKSVTIPESVTWISCSTFEFCIKLTSIHIPSSVTAIDVSAFQYCSSLKHVSIDNGLISIDDEAFCGCTSLESVTIPDSVMDIGARAFSDCSNLNKVIFTGTREQWENVEVKYDCFEDCPCSIVVCTDGVVSL